MKRVLFFCVAILVAGAAMAKSPKQAKLEQSVDRALAHSVKQSMLMYDVIKAEPGLLPRSAKDGRLITCKSNWWTSGFYPGTLWYLYESSGDQSVKVAAQTMTERMAKEQHNRNTHDIGFMINCSFGNGYRLTGDKVYRQALVNAANAFSTRFDPRIGCTRSWTRKDQQFTVIIDNMMNLELLGVAAALTGEKKYLEKANSHATRTMECHYRPDGSSYHVVQYDSITGAVHKRHTHQGINDDSAWSRGQAWGLYGYVMMYRQSGKQEFLDHAIKIANFIMNHPNLPKDKIPYWDFDAPAGKKTLRDASAGTLIASALLELSTYATGNQSAKILAHAEDMLRSLCSHEYLAALGENNNFMIKHCTGFVGKNYEIDAPLSYGDYYFVEALMRYKRLVNGRPIIDKVMI